MYAPADAGYAPPTGEGDAALPLYSLAEPGTAAFVAMSFLLAALAVVGVAVAAHRLREGASSASRAIAGTGVLAAVWLGASWLAARSGALSRADAGMPASLLGAMVVLAVGLALSGYGRRLALGLPLWSLVLVQAFRWPLALAMQSLSARSIVPALGDLDVVLGASAVLVAAIAGRRRARALVFAWNLFGLAALARTVVVAVVAAPPVRFVGEEHGTHWVARAPFVWFPAAMLLFAFAGHLLVFVALRAAADTERGRSRVLLAPAQASPRRPKRSAA